jgi:tRNA-dihydrouridine synthase
MLEQTGCDGVMIARGGLGNPWLFRESLQLLSGMQPTAPTREERLDVSLRHMEEFIHLSGEIVALREMRKHFCWYAKGLSGASRFRGFVNRAENRSEFISGVTDFFQQQGDWAL